jgi:hypothetical protein
VTNTFLQNVANGAVLDFGVLEGQYGTTEFAMVCLTQGGVASAILTDTFGTNETDNSEPFSLNPGTGNGVESTPFQQQLGAWTVTCQPFCEDNAAGASGTEEAINFAVTYSTNTPTSSPTSTPTNSPTTSAPTSEECSADSECIDSYDRTWLVVLAATRLTIHLSPCLILSRHGHNRLCLVQC